MQRLIVVALTLILGFWVQGSWAGGGRKIDRCNGYLLAPDQMKPAARTLLKIKPPKAELGEAKDQLLAYIAGAPLGSEEVLAFLEGVYKDSLESRGEHLGFNFSLVNRYLMRPGNEALSSQHLETVIRKYWDDLMEYHSKPQKWDWLEQQTQFIERLAALYPLPVRQIWNEVAEQNSKELVQYLNLNPIVGATSSYLSDYMNWDRYELRNDNEAFEKGDEDTVKKRKRLEYIQWIVNELQAKLSQNDIASLKRLYVIRDPWFAENQIYARDAEEFSGESLGNGDAAVVEVIFLQRLARRLNLWTPEQKRFENYFNRFQSLLPRYPRSAAGGGGHVT